MAKHVRLEKFNELVGLLFADMLETFPFSAAISVEDAAKRLGAKPGDFINNDEPHWAGARLESGELVHEFLAVTLNWLEQEGFVRQRHSMDDFSYELTAKTFSALNATPKSLQGRTTIGQALISAVKSGGKQLGSVSISELATLAISAGTAMVLKS